MQIRVNGEAVVTDADSLAALCASLGYGEAKVATALNGNFIPAGRRADTPLSPNDAVEIVAPREGG